MRFLPHVTFRLILAFLRDSSCKAVPLEGLDAVAIEVERGLERIILEITDAGRPSAGTRARGLPVYAVANFPQAQMALEGLRWRPSLLSD